jgi:Leucine-rich repeat (LRR) protein
VLDLSSNPIGLISASFFNGLCKLEKLDLTRCHMIRKIDSNAFNQMLNLREVDLPNTVDLVGMANNLDSLLPDMEVVSLEMC